MGKEGGNLEAKVVTEEDKQMPPVKGWTYWDGDEDQSDPTLVCSREVTPACSEIVVELQGAAKEEYPELAGSYLPVDLEGEINRGRWVGSYQQHSFAALQLSSIELLHICVFDKY